MLENDFNIIYDKCTNYLKDVFLMAMTVKKTIMKYVFNGELQILKSQIMKLKIFHKTKTSMPFQTKMVKEISRIDLHLGKQIA